MAIETIPDLRPWRWYVGALHQHHYALAMLMEFHIRPWQEGAERAWKCLDWVFDVSPSCRGLPEQRKAQLILTDIRNEMTKYFVARKVRCSSKAINAADMLRALPLEARTFSGENTSRSRSASGSFSPPSSKRLSNNIAPLPTAQGWPPIANGPMKLVGLANGGPKAESMKRMAPSTWVCTYLSLDYRQTEVLKLAVEARRTHSSSETV